ncbi:sensor histidine kinase [Clostridium felsineum]|uniref:sensor histidine kinase n=1 Tax=Clostridium felsineum TaxID=36839 RepID=UPI001FA86597|nr:HAMP domain-containing sensor histidine kinase [Clostridium felsineum]
MILFYVIWDIYVDRDLIIGSVTGDIKSRIYSNNNHVVIKRDNEIPVTKNFIFKNSNKGGIEKDDIQVHYSKKEPEIGYLYKKTGNIVDMYKNECKIKQCTYNQNYVETIFDEDNNVIMSNLIADDYLKYILNNQYDIESSKKYFNNRISLQKLLNTHNNRRLLVITDRNDNVIRFQVLGEYDYNKMAGRISDDDFLQMTLKQIKDVLKYFFYRKVIYIITVVMLIIIVVNCILSNKYVLIALRPLMDFTYKVKRQSESKEINFIEMPKVKDEIYELTFAYNSAMKKIKKSYDDMKRLNSYASHELRNSLSVLRAKIELDDDKKDIERYIDKLTNTTNDILAMSTPKLCSNNENIDLALICAKVVDEYTGVFDNIELELPDDGVDLIKGKEMWIERCIINLIDNSIKFVDKNKKINKIVVEVVETTEDIIISVLDNGIGIEEKEVEKILKLYYGTNGRISTGIGLAYVKHIMDLHGGKVLVKSKKGEYSKISLIFPKNINSKN